MNELYSQSKTKKYCFQYESRKHIVIIQIQTTAIEYSSQLHTSNNALMEIKNVWKI